MLSSLSSIATCRSWTIHLDWGVFQYPSKASIALIHSSIQMKFCLSWLLSDTLFLLRPISLLYTSLILILSQPHAVQPCGRSPLPGSSGLGHSLQQRTETRLPLKIEDVGKEVAGSFPCWVGTVPTPPGRTFLSSFLLDPAGEDSWVSRQFFTDFEHRVLF